MRDYFVGLGENPIQRLPAPLAIESREGTMRTNNRIHVPSAPSALIATVAIMVMSLFPSALAYADDGSAPTVPVQVSKVDADGTALKGAQLRIRTPMARTLPTPNGPQTAPCTPPTCPQATTRSRRPRPLKDTTRRPTRRSPSRLPKIPPRRTIPSLHKAR